MEGEDSCDKSGHWRFYEGWKVQRELVTMQRDRADAGHVGVAAPVELAPASLLLFCQCGRGVTST